MSTPPLPPRERPRDPGEHGPRVLLEDDPRSSLITLPPPGLSSQMDVCWATTGRAGGALPGAHHHLVVLHPHRAAAADGLVHREAGLPLRPARRGAEEAQGPAGSGAGLAPVHPRP